ncbi:hypothetical protein [Legionella fallonii]|uniref:Uncharacterized protein n=1 Tax=Legionella fallonii LLAP-10 TaxID=1212491 RepID=A0A098G5L6_9GAMM|nr:hypothetical protein [Legionella fallonii]CEG57747.1 conserved protein of unknown function [Legionella fallonii LLAP-10]
MGHNDKAKANIANEHNKLGISSGLVSQRRNELSVAKILVGLGARTPNVSPVVHHTDEGQKKSATELTHLTKSRPMFTQHRPPSRQPRHGRHYQTDLIILLNRAISDATANYRDYYLNGVNTLQPNGWFSWWRHGVYGQNKAAEVNEHIQKYDSISSIMTHMNLFFQDPYTQYDNHSYATYLLHEFNKLLEHFSLPGCKPPAGEYYDKSSWPFVAKQLQQLMPAVNEQDNSHEDEKANCHGIKTH